LSRLEKLKDSDKPQEDKIGRTTIDTDGKTKNQVLKEYYEILISTTGGNVRKASALAGVPNSTFREQLEKLKNIDPQ
jgi:hypothetical protein